MNPLDTPVTPVFDLSASITAAISQITATISANLPAELTVAGGLVAVFIGWRLFKRFVH